MYLEIKINFLQTARTEIVFFFLLFLIGQPFCPLYELFTTEAYRLGSLDVTSMHFLMSNFVGQGMWRTPYFNNKGHVVSCSRLKRLQACTLIAHLII